MDPADPTVTDEHDRRLAELTGPDGRPHPTPRSRYDLVVIGGGTGGLVAAVGAASVGASVAIVERRRLGGDCLHFGCVPSKALIRAGRGMEDVRSAAAFGITAEAVRVDFAAAMQVVRSRRAELAPNDSADRLRSKGVDVFFGRAEFADARTIGVDDVRLRFRRAIIATGTRPRIPTIPGLSEVPYLTNESVFDLQAQPTHLAVIGAGPIGVELAQAFRRLGSAVDLYTARKFLVREDPDAVEVVRSAVTAEGVNVVDTPIDRIDPADRTISAGDVRRPYSHILVAVGRKPNVESLGLERVGIAVHADGVVVNDRLRTSVRGIFAVGDVASKERFTHAADAMARIAVRNALFFGRQRVSRLVIPRCTYTSPELACVGLTESAARRMGRRTRTLVIPFDEIDRALLDGRSRGFAKVVLPDRGDRILGAVICGPGAGDLIGPWTDAVKNRRRLSDLGSVITPYPNYSSVASRLADAYNRTRLTPTNRWLLDRLLRFGRWFG